MAGIFEREVERLRRAGVPGASGRLRDLFDVLAARGPAAQPLTQAEIASAVFGQDQTDADDATVRVYVHRLRKRIDDFYDRNGMGEGGARIELPAGAYRLVLVEGASGAAASPGAGDVRPRRRLSRLLPALGVIALLAAFALGALLGARPERTANAAWAPLVASDRPVLIVLGDYYIFGEIDPVRPEEGRLIRDFRVNSPEDLAALQEAEPGRYGFAEDFGLNYLPFSAAYGLTEIVPMLADNGKPVSVMASSQLDPDMLNYFDVVYIGLTSGLGVLEDPTFAGSTFALGESYDEIVDSASGTAFVSEEARRVASPAFYRDYAFLTRYTAATGAQVMVVAAQRDTGLRAIAPIAASGQLPAALADAARAPGGFAALYEITGQQGADLDEKLVAARARD